MDLVGKTFIFEKHDNYGSLIWHSGRENLIGHQFEVLTIHKEHPEYAYIKQKDSRGLELYYPTKIIERQLNPNSVEDLYKEIFKLTKEICK